MTIHEYALDTTPQTTVGGWHYVSIDLLGPLGTYIRSVQIPTTPADYDDGGELRAETRALLEEMTRKLNAPTVAVEVATPASEVEMEYEEYRRREEEQEMAEYDETMYY